MKQFNFLTIAAVAIISLLTAGCSKDTDDLLSTVPADCSMVSVINIKEIADELDFKVSDGKVEIPAAWQQPLQRVSEGFFGKLAIAEEAIDLSNVVAFTRADGTMMITFRVEKESKLKDLFGKPESEGGYNIYKWDSGTVLLVRNSQGWFLAPYDAVNTVNATLKAASAKRVDENSGNISDLSGVRMALDEDKALRVAMNMGRVLNDTESWAVGLMEMDKNEMEMDIQFMQPDGKVIPFTNLQTLSTDFLRYTPGNASFVAAIGATPDTDWDRYIGILSYINDPQVSGMIGTITPYLQKADGTVAVAANVDIDDPAASGSTFLAMVHMPQSDVDAALAEIQEKLLSMGATPKRDSNGMISVPGLYAGNVDGYLAVASQPFKPTENNSFTKYFLSRKAAMVMILPQLPQLGIQRSVTFNIEVETQTIELKLTSQDSLADVIGQILGVVI